MRIGIDCRYIFDVNHGELAGVGHYTYFLIKYLLSIDRENEYYLFLYNKKIKCQEWAQQKNVKCIYFPGLETLGKIPFFYRHVFIPYILKRYRLDVYHNPANVIPCFYFGRSIITIHDLAIYKNKNWFPNRQYFSRLLLTPSSIYKAKKIIAVSENTRDDLIKIFKVKPTKIEVIHEGVEDYSQINIDESKIDAKFKIVSPYFLFLGTLEPRKNIVRLVDAYAKFLEQNKDSDCKLVLAGKKGWKYGDIFKKIEELNLQQHVLYVGYVGLNEKIYLIKKSLSFVFPSLYEGFGLPILEAMNLGAPIITSNVASIPEIVIDNAVLVEPQSIESITAALNKIVQEPDLRAKLINKGRGIARNFSWESCARKTLEVYKTVSKNKNSPK